MELNFDFIFKLYFRIPACRKWFDANQPTWEFLFEWLENNRDPPT